MTETDDADNKIRFGVVVVVISIVVAILGGYLYYFISQNISERQQSYNQQQVLFNENQQMYNQLERLTKENEQLKATGCVQHDMGVGCIANYTEVNFTLPLVVGGGGGASYVYIYK